VADRWQRLGELAVSGANLQRGQVLMVSAEHGVEVWCDERLVGSFAPRKRRN